MDTPGQACNISVTSYYYCTYTVLFLQTSTEMSKTKHHKLFLFMLMEVIFPPKLVMRKSHPSADSKVIIDVHANHNTDFLHNAETTPTS